MLHYPHVTSVSPNSGSYLGGNLGNDHGCCLYRSDGSDVRDQPGPDEMRWNTDSTITAMAPARDERSDR